MIRLEGSNFFFIFKLIFLLIFFRSLTVRRSIFSSKFLSSLFHFLIFLFKRCGLFTRPHTLLLHLVSFVPFFPTMRLDLQCFPFHSSSHRESCFIHILVERFRLHFASLSLFLAISRSSFSLITSASTHVPESYPQLSLSRYSIHSLFFQSTN